ncbi:MAG: dihydroorotase [Planctomycetota bacterium]
MDVLELPRIDDLHVHLRQGELMRQVAPLSRAGGAGRVLAMPNLRPPLDCAAAVSAYRTELIAAEPALDYLMTLYAHPGLDGAELERARAAGVVAVKWYPQGVTTNSDAAAALEACYPVFAAAEELGIVLSLHGEMPDDPARGIDRANAEQAFLPRLEALHRRFPQLRIICEHATSREALDLVRGLGETVACTITAHHLELTAADWQQDPHAYCKPVAKSAADREALCAAAISGHPRIFFGSDSAPHPAAAKAGVHPAAGVFTAPVLASLLATRFDALGALPRLRDFTCVHGAAFYGLPPASGTLRLRRQPWTVPAAYGGVVPFAAGRQLAWRCG